MEQRIGQQIGKYRILGELGRGTVGTVYRAYDSELGRDIALKALPPDSAWDRTLIESFLQQARATAGLPHPNIVAVFDVAQIEGWTLVAMELLEGIPLDELTRLRGGLLLEEVSAIVRQLASALDYLHQEGQIHGDVRSGNVFLSPPDRVVLTELGVIRTSWEGRIATSTATAATSPEQISGAELGPWTDLYALGVIAYELLIARPPFAADTVPALLHQIVSLPLPPLAPLRPDLPVAVERALLRALAKDPRARFASGAELAEALERVEPRAAPRPGPLPLRPAVLPLEGLLAPVRKAEAPAEPAAAVTPAAVPQAGEELARPGPAPAGSLEEALAAPSFGEAEFPWAEAAAPAAPSAPTAPVLPVEEALKEALADLPLPEDEFPWEELTAAEELAVPLAPEQEAPAFSPAELPWAGPAAPAEAPTPAFSAAELPWADPAAPAEVPAAAAPAPPAPARAAEESLEAALADLQVPEDEFAWAGFAAPGEAPAAAAPAPAAPGPMAGEAPEGTRPAPAFIEAEPPWAGAVAPAPMAVPVAAEPASASPGAGPLDGAVVRPATPVMAAAPAPRPPASRGTPADRLARTQPLGPQASPAPAVAVPTEEAPTPRRLPAWVWVVLGVEVLVLVVGIVLLVLFLLGM